MLIPEKLYMLALSQVKDESSEEEHQVSFHQGEDDKEGTKIEGTGDGVTETSEHSEEDVKEERQAGDAKKRHRADLVDEISSGEDNIDAEIELLKASLAPKASKPKTTVSSLPSNILEVN